MLRALAIIALAASVWASSPADAHVGGDERAVFEAPQLPPPLEPAAARYVLVAGEAPDNPWPLAVMVLLAAVALARRRSRGLVAAFLVLLITIFGLEAAVHSVHHHALGSDPVACPTASMAAHLDGTTVVELTIEEPLPRVGATATQPDPLLVALRSLDPSQPRAPPSPLV